MTTKHPVTLQAPAASVQVAIPPAEVRIVDPASTLPPEDAIVALVNVLYAPWEGAVIFDGRTVSGVGELRSHFNFDGRARLKLADQQLQMLAEHDWGATVTAAFSDLAMNHPLRLPALFVCFDTAPEFGNGEGGWKWRPNEARVRDVAAALDAFPIAPAVVIDGLTTQAALWPLVEPIPADDRARGVLEQLAARLGGTLLPDPCAALIPVPGFIVRNVGTIRPLPVVKLTRLIPDQRTTLDAIELALATEAPGA
jgi:hypothetical protein